MKICLLGASGSIGTQTIDVINNNPSDFTLVSFSVGNNDKPIDEILLKHKKVEYVFMLNTEKAKLYSEKYKNVKFLSSDGDLQEIITLSNPDMVVNALVGFSGLLPSIRTLQENRKLALANKESLIVGGELINRLLEKGNGALYPIDSEHSALWKCLKVDNQNVEKLIITASGGAFRNLTRDELKNVTKDDALNHPTWKMGNKITIDCATMMNKAFEIIEAHYLFGFEADKIMVKLHKESKLHSAVKYKNGLYRGEINEPDMRNAIKFAMYEGNIPFETTTFDAFDDLKELTFADFVLDRYPLVGLAKRVIEEKGNLGAVINSANEVAVKAFLNDEITFLDIENIVFDTVNKIPFEKVNCVEDLITANDEAKKYALHLVNERSKRW